MLLVNIQILEALADQILAVRRVVDDEIFRIGTEMLDLHAEKPGAEGVKRTQPDIACSFSNQRIDAVTHLTRRFVRKGDGKNAIRRNMMLQEVGDTEGQHACLAGARSCHDQKRSVKAGYGSLLWLVQPLKQIHENSFAPIKKGGAAIMANSAPAVIW